MASEQPPPDSLHEAVILMHRWTCLPGNRKPQDVYFRYKGIGARSPLGFLDWIVRILGSDIHVAFGELHPDAAASFRRQVIGLCEARAAHLSRATGSTVARVFSSALARHALDLPGLVLGAKDQHPWPVAHDGMHVRFNRRVPDQDVATLLRCIARTARDWAGADACRIKVVADDASMQFVNRDHDIPDTMFGNLLKASCAAALPRDVSIEAQPFSSEQGAIRETSRWLASMFADAGRGTFRVPIRPRPPDRSVFLSEALRNKAAT